MFSTKIRANNKNRFCLKIATTTTTTFGAYIFPLELSEKLWCFMVPVSYFSQIYVLSRGGLEKKRSDAHKQGGNSEENRGRFIFGAAVSMCESMKK